MNERSKLNMGLPRFVPTAALGVALALGLGVLAGCPVEETPRRDPAPAEPTPPPDRTGTQPGTEPGAHPSRPEDPYGN